jgi:hypothetical protein
VVNFHPPFSALFKSCHVYKGNVSIYDELFSSEVYSSAIDSILGIRRVPAVAPRILRWSRISDLVRSDSRFNASHMMYLNHINKWCHKNAADAEGVLIGWIKYPAVPYLEFKNDFFSFRNVIDVNVLFFFSLIALFSCLISIFRPYSPPLQAYDSDSLGNLQDTRLPCCRAVPSQTCTRSKHSISFSHTCISSDAQHLLCQSHR